MTIQTHETRVTPHGRKRTRSDSFEEGSANKRVKRSEATPHITRKMIDVSRQRFLSDEMALLARDGVSMVGLEKMLIDRFVYDGINHHYSITVGDRKNVGEQKRSGRCWLFASLNMMRQCMLEKYNLETFEFSQPFLYFWDKYEKVNYFLNLIIKYRGEPASSENNRSVLNYPAYDGGYWYRFVNLVKKYGLAPKSVMAESFHSSDSLHMNKFLESKCREYARDLRNLHAAGCTEKELMYKKNQILEEVFDFLCRMLGGPPVDKFAWQYEDKEGNVHTTEEMTPLEFAENMLPFNVDDKVILMNAPSGLVPFGRVCTHAERGNVVGSPEGRYLNLTIEEIKEYVVRSLRDRKEAVCFTCDVSKDANFGSEGEDESLKSRGILDPALFNYQRVLGTTKSLDKRERIEFHDTVANHLMLISGVDIKTDKKGKKFTAKWRVENSWGKKRCCEGYFNMSDQWFEENTFHFVIDKSLLNDEHLLAHEEGDVIEVPKWWLMEKVS